MNGIYQGIIDGIPYRLKKETDLSFLKQYGRCFRVFDETGSGCISFGMEKGNEKYFVKTAGADTLYGEVTPQESVVLLKNAAVIYEDLKGEPLILLKEKYSFNDLYVTVFAWAEGECLFDHWNFEYYKAHPDVLSPRKRFRLLPLPEKLKTAERILCFLERTAEKGYTAVDFYDGSLLYDFETEKLTVCDIDLFRHGPQINDQGEGWFGTKRLKAPEENETGALIDEVTNVFTAGALLMDLFSTETTEKKRYDKGMFIPDEKQYYTGSDASYEVLMKAVSYERSERWQTIREFHEAWRASSE